MSQSLRARLAGLALISYLFVPAWACAQSISITGGLTGPETFDTLPNTGTGSTLPNGWYFSEVGTAANTTYAADDGTLNTGNTYSYGTASTTDRAFGGLQSGSLNPTIGAQLTNNTGATLTDLVVQYTGEQWRLGATGRVDRLDFQYSTDATSLTTGTWNNVDTLDFTAPVSAGTVGKLDGNVSANRTAINATISGLNIANGATIWVRWNDFNPSGSDDGLAIDDVRFGTAGDFPPTVTSTVPADGATNIAPNATITINFSESVTTNPGWIDISCDTSGAHPAVESGSGNTRTLTPNTAFTPGENCTVSIDGTQVIDQDGTLDPMAGNVRFGFTVGADQPPTVQTTSPTNNATNVSATTDLTIKFSEPVTVAGSWFTISCTSGMHTAVADTGPTTYVINPDVDFSAGDACDVTILAANVTDQDGTPNNMAANYLFHFAVAAGDTPPTVVRTSPADAAPSVPWQSDISVFFSEAVTAPAGAFALSCANSGSHTFALSNSTDNKRFLLNPDSMFGASELCTLTITGAQVLDMDGTPNPMAMNYTLHFTTQPLATNYWNGVDASSCMALRTGIHNKIKDHVPYMYSASNGLTTATATWNILEDADQDPLNSGHILDIYRNRSYVKVTDRSGAQDGAHYNREHTWPNSHGFNDANGLDTNGDAFAPYTDTHMLYLSAADYNADRGNNPYGAAPPINGGVEEATDAYAGYGGGTGVYPGNSNWTRSTTYEVWNHRRGDAARAVLYMDVRYEGGTSATGQAEPDLIVTDNAALITNTASGVIAPTGYMGLKAALEQWNTDDPVDAAERLRNDIIYGYQGNRNPFIDHPEWVACVFECQCTLPDAMFKDSFE